VLIIKHLFVRLAAACLLACNLLACSASTRYVPQRSDHLYLVMRDGALSYSKNSRVLDLHGPEAQTLLSCSERAAALGRDATERANDAKSLVIIGSLLLGVGSLVLTPIAIQRMHEATAQSIDSLNLHNDDVRCVPQRVTASAAKGQP
jgi:hypothetical protein